MRAKVYLNGTVSQSTCGQESHAHVFRIPVESLCIVRFYSYAATLSNSVDLIFVEDVDKMSQWTCSLSSLLDLRYTLLKKADLRDDVSNVRMPVLQSEDDGIVRSGLSSVLRILVRLAHCADPRFGYLRLLGHKEACLKACSQVSSWTKLCEVDLPVCMSAYSSKVLSVLNASTMACLRRLEARLCEAYDVQPRILCDTAMVADDGVTSCCSLELFCKELLVSSSGAGHLESKGVRCFVEGRLPTIADFIAVVCLNHFLEATRLYNTLKKTLPHLAAWYKRMKSLPGMERTGLDFGIEPSSGTVPTESSLTGLAASHEVTQGIREVHLRDGIVDGVAKLSMKLKVKASQESVARAVEKLQAHLPDGGVTSCLQTSEPIEWHALPFEAHPSSGGIPASRAVRKCEQLSNMCSAVRKLVANGSKLVDFCSGGGHLGILLACLMPTCRVYLVENKEESLQKAVDRLQKLRLQNITIYQCNLNQFVGAFDVGVALHACGASTDMVLRRCIAAGAAFVVAPCCYGSIRPCSGSDVDGSEEPLTLPRSSAWSAIGVSPADCLTLGHAADQTEFNRPLAELGKQCMNLVDSDRVLWARAQGYQVDLYTMDPPDCSPKNNVLVGCMSAVQRAS